LGGLEDTSTRPDLADTQSEQLRLFDDNFNQLPDETYSSSANSLIKIAKPQSLKPFRSIPTVQKQKQTELFREMPKSKKRRQRKRKY
jgi:hypothetical protein